MKHQAVSEPGRFPAEFISIHGEIHIDHLMDWLRETNTGNPPAGVRSRFSLKPIQ